MGEAAHRPHIVVALLKDADLVLDARLAEPVDAHAGVDDVRVLHAPEEEAVRLDHYAVFFGLWDRRPAAAVSDQIVVDYGVESRVRG